MPRPVPTGLAHFTHVDNLPTIVTRGLLADSVARNSKAPAVDVGNATIKEARRRRNVPLGQGGVVADYVPFYFAPRSPMMYAIRKGNVPTYDGGCDSLLYLVTSVERLVELGLGVVFTDRNATLTVATFAADVGRLDEMIDWPLMAERYWYNTVEEPDRVERRMAECLVHQRVPFAAIIEVAAQNDAVARRAQAALATVEGAPPVVVRANWYF